MKINYAFHFFIYQFLILLQYLSSIFWFFSIPLGKFPLQKTGGSFIIFDRLDAAWTIVNGESPRVGMDKYQLQGGENIELNIAP